MALEAIQAQAGHASIESTRIYLHLGDDWLAAQYRRAPSRRRTGVQRPSHDRAASEEPAVNAPARYFTWNEIEQPAPILAATMQAYLQQIACTLRPASVNNADWLCQPDLAPP